MRLEAATEWAEKLCRDQTRLIDDIDRSLTRGDYLRVWRNLKKLRGLTEKRVGAFPNVLREIMSDEN